MSRPGTGSQCGDPKCVCALCTCGEHHCDKGYHGARDGTKVPFAGASTTHVDYQRHAPCKAEGYKPDARRQGPSAPFEGESINQSDFIELKREEPVWQRKTVPYKPNSQAFDGTSTTKQDFVNFEGSAKREPIHQVDARKAPGPGSYEATYATDYPGYTAPKQSAMKPSRGAIGASNVPMNTETSSSTYKAYPGFERTIACSPARRAHGVSQPLESTTESRSAYSGARGEVARPFKPEVRKVAKLPGQYQTTYGADLTPKSAEAATSFKPSGVYTAPVGTFHGDTTQKSDFTNKGNATRETMRPQAAQRRDPGQFDDRTINKQDYHNHGKVCPSSLLSVQKRAEMSRYHKV
eukprot:m.167156 g.167156  ORF g.167156 m.167156 type:complete len:351 (+) comp24083_c0_seq1:252-1304(+)